MSDFSMFFGILLLAIPATSPILIACLGEIITERSGVLNLGVEGAMSVGALTSFVVAIGTGSPYVGFLAGTAGGVLITLIHAYLCISLKSDQVISGVMLTLLGIALTTYFGQPWIGADAPGFGRIDIPGIGAYFTVVDFLALLLVPIVWYFLFYTNFGLEIIAVGDDAKTADTMGIDVHRVRYSSTLIGGAFSGAAGAALSLGFLNLWTSGLVSGRGWIAIALVIFAQWQPIRALIGAYLFGVIDAAQFRAQSVAFHEMFPLRGELAPFYDVVLDPVIMSTYPYLVTILVLAIASRKATVELGMPMDLLVPYTREQ